MERIQQPAGDVPVPLEPAAAPRVILGPNSDVGSLRARLRELRAAVYVTKAELYARLVDAEAKAELHRLEREWLDTRRSQLAGGAVQEELAQLKVPDAPSELAIRQHEDRQHLPPEPWCMDCLMARSTAAPHASIHPNRPTMPRFELDFNYYTSGMELIPVEKGQPKEKPFATTLTVVDKPAQSPLHITVPTKSPKKDAYMVKSSVEFVKRQAYQKAEMRTDGEPSTLALANQIKAKSKAEGIDLTVTATPRYSSASLGAVGKAQDLCARQVRTLRTNFEKRYGIQIGPDDDIWPWLVRHSGWCIERFHVRGNGTTSFEDWF